jgi:hypothetical protein
MYLTQAAAFPPDKRSYQRGWTNSLVIEYSRSDIEAVRGNALISLTTIQEELEK